MALYLISYDIAEKDAFEYDNLWEKLKQMNAVRILYSEWAIAYPAGEEDNIYNAIAKCVQGKDSLLVQEMTGTATWDKLLVTDDRFRQLLQSAA
jgi:CRISPR/Cas system-associated endoribonuclease Cas2